ncbi:hypothetical protein [Croceicoccus mobilis]|uniref:Roadblock/LAMTOR2 domain-containing protein n=1 Tax=Croceicoccus mobilis TaxID=1703339 RepID=A0A916YQ68_9SPHN|nr:hypothetical protein [Croceicoccus mobilis]GGD55959.1 hypothetical protein GCM10010990_01420 [Croceicoccus mobilis]
MATIEQPASLEEKLAECMDIDGAMAAAVIDEMSGMALATVGKLNGGADIDLAAAGNTEVMRAELKMLKHVGLGDDVEDILITLGEWYELLRPLTDASGKGMFVYVALDRRRANLALARIKLREVEAQLAL